MEDTSPNDRYLKLLNYISLKIPKLKNDERNDRKKALIGIANELNECGYFVPQAVYEQLFISFHKDFLICLNDPVEKCRELAANILEFLLSKLTTIDKASISTIIGTLLMCLSSPDERETSEEVRELEIDILTHLIKLGGINLLKHMNDVVHILVNCIVDPSPEIKRKSCDCATEVSYHLRGHFQAVSASLINPLLQTVSHQHWKTRVSCVMAIGSVIQYGNNDNVVDVIGHLAQRLFDHIVSVRAAVMHIVGTWLVELPDRYSYFPRLLPLLLSSLTDVNAELSSKALKYWQKAGEVYLQENEKDYKDQIDFPKPVPENYPGSQPSIGCRILIQRYIINILPSVLYDFNDWSVETRPKAAKLLYTLLLHCEEKATMNLQLFLEGISKAAKSEDKESAEMGIKAAKLLGYFTEANLWCDNLLSSILETPYPYLLLILAALIKGSAKKKELKDLFPSICSTLANPCVCRIRKIPETQASLLLCIEVIILSPNEVDPKSSYDLFSALTSVAALSLNNDITQKVDKLLKLVCSVDPVSSVAELYKMHGLKFLKELIDNFELWTSHNPEGSIFIHLLKTGYATTDILELAVPVIIHNVAPEKDPKLKSQMINLITTILKRNPEHPNQELSSSSVFSIIHGGIFPTLIWSAGYTAAALRTIAAANLYEMLHAGRIDSAMLSSVGEELMRILISLTDDDLSTNRLFACKIFTCALPVLTIDEHHIHKTMQEFLKCLDDEIDDVRIADITLFRAYFQVFPQSYNWAPYKSYLKHMYHNILIHMDDQKKEIRMNVFELLKDISFACPEILLKEVENVKYVMAASELCDKLCDHIKNLQLSDENIS